MYTKKLIALGLNLTMFVLGIIGCSLEIGRGFVGVVRYYTFDSNLMGTVSSGILCAFIVISLARDTETIPKWVLVFKYMSTCMLTVTFLVVITVLAPMYSSYFSSPVKAYTALLFNGNMLYQHFLCPILAITSTLFSDTPLSKDDRIFNSRPTPLKSALTAVIPTMLYAIVIVILNILKVIEGPYPFLMVYAQPVWASILWFIALFLLSGMIAWLLARFGTLLKNYKTVKNT